MKSLYDIICESNNHKIYVNMIVLNHDKTKLLILRRANYMKKFGGMWGFPGGSLDSSDADYKSGAIRELEEETQIKLTFMEKHNCKKFESITTKDNVTIVYFITTLESENVPEVKISREHAKYEWVDVKQLKSNHSHYKFMPQIFQIIQKIFD